MIMMMMIIIIIIKSCNIFRIERNKTIISPVRYEPVTVWT
jgi:hypothetical protein